MSTGFEELSHFSYRSLLFSALTLMEDQALIQQYPYLPANYVEKHNMLNHISMVTIRGG